MALELGERHVRRRYHVLRLAAMELLREARYDEQTKGPVPVSSEALERLWKALEIE